MTQSRAIVDKLLTDVSNKLMPQGYISEMILPLISVKQRTGKLGTYGNDHLRIVNTHSGGRGEYLTNHIENRSDSLYSIEEHAVKDFVTQMDYDNFEKPFDAERDVTYSIVTGKQF